MVLARLTRLLAPLERWLDAGAAQRLQRIGPALGLGMIGLLLAAPGIWRDHPILAPLAFFSDSFRLGSPLDLILLVSVGLASAGLLLGISRGFAAAALTVLLVARASWDLALWQPYLLQFGFYAAALAVGLGLRGKGGAGRSVGALEVLRFATAAIYFWSGFSKLHLVFFEDGLFTFWGAGWFELSKGLRYGLSVPAALFETALGVALFTRKGRRFGLYGLVAMHLFLLVMLGAVRQYNPVVWPWNAAMIAVLLFAFGGEGGGLNLSRLRPRLRRPLGLAAVLLFAILPALSYVGWGSTYLSFRLYAYRYDEGYLLATDEAKAGLPDSVAAAMTERTASGLWKLDLFYWSEPEIGAFSPGDEIVFRTVARRIAGAATQPDGLILVLREPPPWNQRRRVQREYVFVANGEDSDAANGGHWRPR